MRRHETWLGRLTLRGRVIVVAGLVALGTASAVGASAWIVADNPDVTAPDPIRATEVQRDAALDDVERVAASLQASGRAVLPGTLRRQVVLERTGLATLALWTYQTAAGEEAVIRSSQSKLGGISGCPPRTSVLSFCGGRVATDGAPLLAFGGASPDVVRVEVVYGEGRVLSASTSGEHWLFAGPASSAGRLPDVPIEFIARDAAGREITTLPASQLATSLQSLREAVSEGALP